MESTRICKQCRQILPENAPEVLCPACLARVALGTESEAPGGTINIDPLAAQAPPPGMSAPPAPAALAVQFPQLDIIELLGRGGMGMVYKARQPRLDRIVALKILPLEFQLHPSFGERFEREAKALAKLNHPGIVAVYDFGQTHQYYYFIMEYVDGMNLRQLLRAQTLEPRQALELVTQVCTALQFAHDAGVVHRDIKPENILLTKSGQVKIADFGLAKLRGAAPDTALTMSQAAMGTLNYMAPEQRENAQKVDHRADIYSLGVVFYELLTGEVPMGRFDPPSKRVQVDVRLDEVVLRALEREPARRYQHASEIKTGVETITSAMPREKATPGATSAFKAQAAPGFASYVIPRFALQVAVWLAAVWCRNWVLGGQTLTVNPREFSTARVLLVLLCGVLDYGWVILPAGLIQTIYCWLEAREKRGLTSRGLPPAIRRRLGRLHTAILGGGYVVVALLTAGLFLFFGSAGITHDETTEWWFAPNGGGYEKLGLSATFSSIENKSKVYLEAPSNCVVTLVIHRTNQQPSGMTVEMPGLRANATNGVAPSFVLDRESLIEWLHKGAGLNPAVPAFQDEAGEIYAFLKTYQNEPPHTAKEFLTLAKSNLQHFWFYGAYSPSGHWGDQGLGTRMLWVFWLVLGETLVYMVLAFWVLRRFYREAWAEISAGRWTPPIGPSRQLPYGFAVLVGLLPVVIAVGVLGLWGNVAGICLLILSACAILVSILSFHSRRQIKELRAIGLWPQPGEPPTQEYVKRLVHAGENVLAIKLYRQLHPVSLMDAKAAVEKMR